MRIAPHWTEYPPDDPPERESGWCSDCEHWQEDCRCPETDEQETNVQKFDRDFGLDQESAASWRKRWEAEQADQAAANIRETPHPYWCWCDDCKERE